MVAKTSPVAGLTDTGLPRGSNEDGLLVEPPLYAVADGMGGHRGGEVASRLTVETVLRAWREASGADPLRELRDAVESASHNLSGFGSVHVAQADLLRLPLRTAEAGGGFDLIYSIIFHLEDVSLATRKDVL